MPLLLRASLTLGLVAVTAAAASAQESVAECRDGVISAIFIDAHSVFDPTDPGLNPRFEWAYRLVNRLHVTTHEEVVAREILFRVGDCYEVERLRDSERLLRALPFIADVDIFGVRQPDGSFHVIVDTQDEWSTRIEPRISSGGTGRTGARFREDNLMGSGLHASAYYFARQDDRVYGVAFWSPQLLGTRWDGALDLGRTETGFLVEQSVSYPFVGQVGRWAFHQAVRHRDGYFEYWMPHGEELVPLWFSERRRSMDLSGAHRWGTEGYNRTLLGGGLRAEWVSYPGESRFGAGMDPDDLPPELPPIALDSVSSVRALFMAGQRNVRYVRRRGLETVNGTEDVRLGLETEIVVGPGLPRLSRDTDLALEAALFLAGELGGVLGGMQMVVEGRRDYEAPAGSTEWNDVFTQLNAWAYWQPGTGSRHTLVGALQGSGGWHNVTPFQVTIGGHAGLRGYPRHVEAGGRRLLASVEHRSHLGWPLPDLFDLGGAVFVDAGKLWRGDVAVGRASPILVNAGVGLRAAFPPGSGRTLRLDAGVPITGGRGHRPVFSIGIGQVVGTRSLSLDPQLARSMRMGSPLSSFVFGSDR